MHRYRAATFAALTLAAAACDTVLGITEFPALPADAGDDATTPSAESGPNVDSSTEAGDSTVPSADAGEGAARDSSLDAGDVVVEDAADATDGGDADDPVVSIAVGANEACAVTASGVLYCWGPGPIGDGMNKPRWQATRIAAASGFATARVCVGNAYGCTLQGVAPLDTTMGGLSCWGATDYGQLALDNVDASAVFLSPVSPTPFDGTSISCGASHGCLAILGSNNGPTQCWGSNSYGELGHKPGTEGDIAISGAPVTEACFGPSDLDIPPPGYPGPIALGDSFSCEIYGTQLYCWGNNASLQLNSLDAGASSPNPVASLAGVSSIAAGTNHACALDEAGVVSCWGDNSSGQLGPNGPAIALGSSALAATISPLGTGAPSIAIAAGGNSACAMVLDPTGTYSVWCWGANERGQLGHDPGSDTLTCPGNAGPCSKQATQVIGVTWAVPPGTTVPAPALAMGPTAACVLETDSTVWCWGSASLVGNGAPDGSTIQFTPVQVQGLPPP
jgi:alpha-tubulin suppressor-like RCC1 family protein